MIGNIAAYEILIRNNICKFSDIFNSSYYNRWTHLFMVGLEIVTLR